MPRPRKTPSDLRTQSLTCRLTEAERLQIEQAAYRAGLTASEYLRRHALTGRVVVRETRTLDHAAFDQLRRIGVNLNQLARHTNATGALLPEVARAAEAVERVLSRLLDDGSAPAAKGDQPVRIPERRDGPQSSR